ncbi:MULTISPECIES: type II CAAX endopeptidase family protein [unclassified Streptomyces]|uniref:CPBP family intramembrane glutamic endopeptidase n=1 Tax=unclassified Streptomyces TaxID=2593676 RepID=UPI002E15DEEE|nr:CPBP family intramembrane metalloprotease [Streptomyces sp. NBC_01186]WSS42785.1 CPBP family intramembrane metalloprotease [Streptomyces sp. NBC_01187]
MPVWSLRSLKRPLSPEPVTAGVTPPWLRPTGVRLVVMLVLFVAVGTLTGVVEASGEVHPVPALMSGAAVGAIALLLYGAVVRAMERRAATELATAAARPGLRTGILLGLGLFTVTIAVIALFGGYRVAGWGSVGGAVSMFGLMVSAAVTEEILFRGVVFRLVEELTGTWGALVISGLLFGVVHLVNPGATVWGAVAIAVEAGLMLGAAYAATRSLWLPIGLHLGWNLAAGGIFSTTLSGAAGGPTGLFDGAMSGNAALTGGTFGPEASVVAILVCGLPTLVFLRLARRRGRLLTRRQSAARRGLAEPWSEPRSESWSEPRSASGDPRRPV